MALAALIAAVREAEDGSGLVGTLPVAGRSLIERQARLAARAGAAHIVLLVERLPGPLTAAIDRLRRDGVTVEVARSAGDAADRFHPEERVLVFADGALVEGNMIGRMALCPAPALLVMGEAGPTGPFERIDASARWAGLLLVSGEMLRKTVAMLGDWDLHSTLLRRTVGASARRLDIADGIDLGEIPPVMLVRTRAGARAATQASFAVESDGTGWPARLLYGPLARALAAVLLDRPVQSRWLRWGAVGVSALAVPALWKGWLAVGLLLLVAGALLDRLGILLAALRLTDSTERDRLAFARAGCAGAALLAFAGHRTVGDLTPLVLGVVTVAAMAAKAREEGVLARLGRGLLPPLWAADLDALVLLAIPFALAVQSLSGLAALALYAGMSFGIVQHRLALASRHAEADKP